MPSRTRESERARHKRRYHEAKISNNMGSIRARQRRYLAERIAFIQLVKQQPCVECGVQYPPYVMDFDHIRGEKIGQVSRKSMLCSPLERLMQEIEKCDVVCSNCHRERTQRTRVAAGTGVDACG